MSLIVNEGKNRSFGVMSNGVGPFVNMCVFSDFFHFEGNKLKIPLTYIAFEAWIRNLQSEKNCNICIRARVVRSRVGSVVMICLKLYEIGI